MMTKAFFDIDGIPAVLWGERSNRLIIAVHGNMSSKTDVPIEMLADTACLKGYQVLSFDLPGHGERQPHVSTCMARDSVFELEKIMNFAAARYTDISLFANSFGAYFSLIAYRGASLQKAWFLSPVVDMKKLIDGMMMYAGVSEQQLETQREIAVAGSPSLYWDYYCYVKANPIDKWSPETYILYGENDSLCGFDTITNFKERFSCRLTVAYGAEHYFHTTKQLVQLKNWLDKVVV